MNIEKSAFEKEGLKLDEERMLTYSQLSCPFDCKYCFTEDLNFNQQRKVPYLSQKQFELIKQLPKEINLLMLGCDTEFFQSKNDAFETLEKLSDIGKDISVVTKMPLVQDTIQRLKRIDEKLNKHQNFLTFSVSIPCIESAKKWEPKVSDPKARIETLKMVHQAGIKTLVAMRPLLPTVSEKELEEIIKETKNFCYGYYSGPLYLKNLEHPLLNQDLSDLKIERIQPKWMPEGNIFYKIEKRGQSEALKNLVKKHNKLLFEGAADGIKYLKNI